MSATSEIIRVGCCGWREARATYFSHFPVVELQDPFYEMPSPQLAAKWRAEAPSGFQFSVKAWQLITHTPASPTYRRLKSPISPTEKDLYGAFRRTEQVWLAWERTRAVARVLDAWVILFQCPASFRPTTENVKNLRAFFTEVERDGTQLAWEPRGGWPDNLVLGLCDELGLLHCVDPFSGSTLTSGTTYWRLHGKGGYRYVYTDEELAALKKRTLEAAERGPVYVLFNNIAMARDALRFQSLLG